MKPLHNAHLLPSFLFRGYRSPTPARTSDPCREHSILDCGHDGYHFLRTGPIFFPIMRRLAFLPSLALLLAASVANAKLATPLYSEFDAWLELHSKSYPPNEYRHRRAVYLSNQALVERHNFAFRAGWTTYAMTADGPFSDLTSDEFATTYLMDPQHCSATTHKSSGTLKSNDR